jgi:hypothetical protein
MKTNRRLSVPVSLNDNIVSLVGWYVKTESILLSLEAASLLDTKFQWLSGTDNKWM